MPCRWSADHEVNDSAAVARGEASAVTRLDMVCIAPHTLVDASGGQITSLARD